MKRCINLSILSIVILICLSVAFPGAVFASDTENTSTADEERMHHLVKAINLKFLSQEPQPAGIVSFDVASDGTVVLGLSSEQVCVYSAEGVFLYGYSFDISEAYLVRWNNGNVALCFCRGDSMATFDREGNCIAMEDMVVSPFRAVTERQVSGVIYRLERDIPVGDSYARLCTTQPNGEKSVFYDATSAANTSALLLTGFVVIFLCTVTPFAIRKLVKYSEAKNGSAPPDSKT